MTSNTAPVHITGSGVASVADVTDVIDRDGLDPERTHLFVNINGELRALQLLEIDADGDVVFTLGDFV